ncbi:unnamed protein product [Absidia cylindrospora]
MIKFGLESKYCHPVHSMIFDLDDDNWSGKFSNAELEELDTMGKPLIRQIPDYLKHHLDQLRRLKSAREAHAYARSNIDYDPSADDLLGWLSTTIINTSALFLHPNNNIKDYPESDQLYRLWGFVNTIFDNSVIKALSKELSSVSNAMAINRKRKLSAVEESSNRRMDTLYVANDTEIGCLEIGGSFDQSKELHDMITNIVENFPATINEVHVVGYSITGKICLEMIIIIHRSKLTFFFFLWFCGYF